MNSTSRIELSRKALQRNIRFLRRRVGTKTRFTSVVKGNAYGHGIDVFVRLAEDCGVRSFATFSADEALEVLRARTRSKSDIMITGAIDRTQLEWAVENGISFYIFDVERLGGAVEAAKRVRKPARVHLEIETGMHRLGLEGEELDRVVELLGNNRSRLQVEGVCTHYAGPESMANSVRIHRQIEGFNETVAWLGEHGVTPRFRHTACSAAALSYPQTVMDMVRIGIAQYGYWPSEETRLRFALEKELSGKRRWVDPLKRVITWKSRILAVKEVPSGEYVGYGMTYLANTKKRIAVVPVGYGDGFTRGLSNRGRVLIRGRRYGVVGMVNMNMTCIDVTESPDIVAGDEVVLIGKQNRRDMSVASFSEMSQFLNYETLVRLPRQIPRQAVA